MVEYVNGLGDAQDGTHLHEHVVLRFATRNNQYTFEYTAHEWQMYKRKSRIEGLGFPGLFIGWESSLRGVKIDSSLSRPVITSGEQLISTQE
jgi:hypothetical protein